MPKKVRVRFAPSPTGPLHIGGVRTALFNYLFAKKHGGDFLLRIEDTDQNRYVPGAEQYIIDALNWCGIPYSEGPGKEGNHAPYKQSERKSLYKKYAEELVEKGYAYYAFDTAENLDNHRKKHEEAGKTFIYNWHNRLKLDNSLSLSPEETKKRLVSGDEYVIRFKCPENSNLVLNDIIRGQINIDTNILDDKVLFKSDGMPTYHLANIVDDHLMEITHVIRGEEWLPSLALHQLLYNAFGWEAPKFAHLPLILKPSGNGKLSKRDGDKFGFPVFPMQWKDPETGDVSRGYKEDGYFPEALINFLALLGWNPGTEKELFSIDELISNFDLSRVNKSGARFDPEKIKWFNHQYLQKQKNTVLADSFMPILSEKGIKPAPEGLEKIIGLVKDRATFVKDFWPLSHYFFEAPKTLDPKAVEKHWKPGTSEILNRLVQFLETLTSFTAIETETKVKEWIASESLGFGQVMPPLRLALVGEMKGPHVFDIMEILGKEETVKRIHNAIDIL